MVCQPYRRGFTLFFATQSLTSIVALHCFFLKTKNFIENHLNYVYNINKEEEKLCAYLEKQEKQKKEKN